MIKALKKIGVFKKLSTIIHPKTAKKRTTLTAFDIGALTTIFFGTAIVSSTMSFLQMGGDAQAMSQSVVFDEHTNWQGIGEELLMLGVAGAYLVWRKFDFGQLNFKVNLKTPLKVLAYVVIAGVVASAFEMAHFWAYPEHFGVLDTGQISQVDEGIETSLPTPTPNLLLFALINGFFEELYFLGLLFCVPKRHLYGVILFGLVVRFAFHTYQGVAGALTITTLGAVFALLRLKDDELVPFFLAHAVFDVVGLTWVLGLLD